MGESLKLATSKLYQLCTTGSQDIQSLPGLLVQEAHRIVPQEPLVASAPSCKLKYSLGLLPGAWGTLKENADL